MNQVTISMTKYMEDHPKLKYIYFGGKGGVGKTVMAGTAALWAAKQGKKTLLASTNPVHSLSSLLEKDVFGKAAVVCDEEKCFAFEIDTKDTIERSKQEIREKINWFLKFADLSTKADEFIESATMNPAFEESAMFENMTDIMFKDEYDFYVFDTAPTANARRLLGMSKVYSLWVDKMLKSREEAKSLKELLSFSKKKEGDPLLDYLLSLEAFDPRIPAPELSKLFPQSIIDLVEFLDVCCKKLVPCLREAPLLFEDHFKLFHPLFS